MKKLAKKSTKKISRRKRKNPENYNMVFSDKQIEKMTASQAIQHIITTSEYPPSRHYTANDDDPFMYMDAEDILKYVHDFANRWEYWHYNK